MARAKELTGSVRPESYSTSCIEQSRTTCTRCGGLMVNEFCIDLFNSSSEIECPARRCVQCGDIIDAVILRNRSIHQHSVATEHQLATMH